jgi:hypothetical protein
MCGMSSEIWQDNTLTNEEAMFPWNVLSLQLEMITSPYIIYISAQINHKRVDVLA